MRACGVVPEASEGEGDESCEAHFDGCFERVSIGVCIEKR